MAHPPEPRSEREVQIRESLESKQHHEAQRVLLQEGHREPGIPQLVVQRQRDEREHGDQEYERAAYEGRKLERGEVVQSRSGPPPYRPEELEGEFPGFRVGNFPSLQLPGLALQAHLQSSELRPNVIALPTAFRGSAQARDIAAIRVPQLSSAHTI